MNLIKFLLTLTFVTILPDIAFANEENCILNSNAIWSIYFLIGLLVSGFYFEWRNRFKSKDSKKDDVSVIILSLLILSFIWPFVVGEMIYCEFFKKKDNNAGDRSDSN